MLNIKTKSMEEFALLVRLNAKPGKEKEVSDFIKSASS